MTRRVLLLFIERLVGFVLQSNLICLVVVTRRCLLAIELIKRSWADCIELHLVDLINTEAVVTYHETQVLGRLSKFEERLCFFLELGPLLSPGG